MFAGGFLFLLVLLFPAIGLYLLYWVIRLGVRHGIADQEAKRTLAVDRIPSEV
ncbi:MAG TPA: hypothetical protein VMH41_07155 [Mycobacteriales bacterium]|nr:hypothetical protein [Mycobacteriales bacterium]